MNWYSFDPIAPWYDRTRILDPASARRAFGFLARLFDPARYVRVLEVGIGTGRVAFPIAAQGYRVVGVDLSRPMIRRLIKRASGSSRTQIAVLQGDAVRLPLRSGTFDIAYFVHILHLIPDWRGALREMRRVVRPGGVLLGIWTEGGPDLPGAGVYYRRCARELGWPAPRIGVRRSETAFAYLERLGCRVTHLPHHWRWTSEVAVGEALRYLDARVFSTVRYLPARLHRQIMRRVRQWARAKFGPANARVPVVGGFTVLCARVPTQGRPPRARPRPRQH